MAEYMKTEYRLPEVTKVDNDYSESKLVLCLVGGKHPLLAKLNVGIDDGAVLILTNRGKWHEYKSH